MCPYPDDYTRKSAPDEGHPPRELDFGHPFSGYSEKELRVVAKSLEATRKGILALNVTCLGISEASIRDHLTGYLSEMIDYLDILDTRLDEAFVSLGD